MIETVNKIYGRGKNRDIYGNVYFAAVVITNRRRIIIPEYGNLNSSENGVLASVIDMLMSKNMRVNESRVQYNYKKVSRDSELEHPESWKIEGGDLPYIKFWDLPNVSSQSNRKVVRPYKIKRF